MTAVQDGPGDPGRGSTAAGRPPTAAAPASPAATTASGGYEGLARRLTAGSGRLLVVADFDGTLAMASRDPAAARIVPLARQALRRLAGIATVDPDRVAVAVLTGRTVADVAARVRVGGIRYLGDHGLQTGTYPRGGRPERIVATISDDHGSSVEPAGRLATLVPELLDRPPWLYVERKGPSVAFHVRQAPDPIAARAAVSAAIAEAEQDLPPHDLAHYRGRLVVDLRPRTAGGKREAMAALLADVEPSIVAIFGDDSSDADAFTVLRAARAAGVCDGLAFAVAGPRPMPDEVAAAADVLLASPREAARVLSALGRAVRRPVDGAGAARRS